MAEQNTGIFNKLHTSFPVLLDIHTKCTGSFFFILGFCSLLRVLYQGYQKNRPSQQLFKVFILYFIYFAAICFGPCWPSSDGIHNYSRKLPHSLTGRSQEKLFKVETSALQT
jgi:hypothetical protein